jgi:hypothetical protein
VVHHSDRPLAAQTLGGMIAPNDHLSARDEAT